MERGIQEPEAVESLIEIANRDASAEFEVKLLAGRLVTRDISDRILSVIESLSEGEHKEEHRLTYTFTDGRRVHILEPANIHKVCVNQAFTGLPVTVERKTRYFDSATGRDMVDCPDILTRFTLRSEKPIKSDYSGDPNDPKAYIRVLHRKSYTVLGGEFRIDFSMVKSRQGTQTLREVLKNVPAYELEIEYIPRKEPRKPADVRQALIRVIEPILAAYLESPAILLQSEMQKYTQEFKYTGIRFYNIVPLERQHISKDRPYNILKGYTVTNKADGERSGLYVARDRRLLRVTNRSITWTGMVATDDSHAEDFMDGEYISGIRLFCIFDAFRYKNKNVVGLPLFTTDEEIKTNPSTSRLGCAHDFVKTLATDFRTVVPGFRVETKLFLAGDGVAMEEAIATLLDTEFEYETDGLVFTPRLGPVSPPSETKGKTWMRVYKWKPPHQNSIDFLLKFDSTTTEYDTVGNTLARRGTLYISRTPGEDIIYPCETMTGEYVPPRLPEDLQRIADMHDRVPSVFQPSTPRDPEAYRIWVPVNRAGMPYDLENKRVDDNTLVECSYDTAKGRWRIMRTRHDKTYEYRVEHRPQYGNDISVAENTWKLIHTPITEEMLKSVVSNPGDDTFEDEAYYVDQDGRESVTKNLRGFHNRIKEGQYMTYVIPGNTILEFAVGRGGDMYKWIKSRTSKVFGLDFSPNNFSLPRGGACVRYLNEKNRGTRNLPKVLFAEGDMTRLLEEQSSRYLKLVFGEEPATTPYLQEFKGVRHWDLAVCQFAIHYACESEDTFKVFIRNVVNHCKNIFFGTCLDGKSVYSILAGKSQYISRSGGRTFAQLEKKYTDDGSWKPEFGQRIDVTLETTEKAQTEYLVPFERIVELFGEAGFELLESKMFEDLYTSQSGISLDSSQQEYSFLHRTFAFRRTKEAISADAEEAAETEVVVDAEEKPSEAEEKPSEEKSTEEKPTEEKSTEEKPTEEKPTEASKKVPIRRKRIVKPTEAPPPPPEIIFFFSKEPTNKEFSNFYEVPFTIDGVEFKSAEHAFQGLKAKTFGDDVHFTKIVDAKSAQSAKSFGKKVEPFDAAEWDSKKENVMRAILKAKFTQNPTLRTLLLDTGDAILAEANPRDKYWGIGTSSTTTIAKNPDKWKGENKLGKLLMELRSELRAEA